MGIYKRSNTINVRLARKARPTITKRKMVLPKRRSKRLKAKSFVARQTRQLGSGTAQKAKRAQVIAWNRTVHQKKTLPSSNTELTIISQGVTPFQRLGTSVRITGINIRMLVVNMCGQTLGTVTPFPLWFNLAIISPKLTNTTPDVTDFFTRNDGIERGQDFNDYANLSGMDYATRAINTANYVVRSHMRFTLGTSSYGVAGSIYGQGHVQPYRRIQRYVKINRTFTWDDNLSSTCKDRLFLVHWASSPQETVVAPTIPGDNGYELTGKVVVFFRDIKS